MDQHSELPVPMLSIEDAKKTADEHGLPAQMASLSVFRVLLHNPAVAKELASTLNTLLFQGNSLDARLRELIIMRIGWKTGSVYEWTQHWRLARQLDIPERDLVAVRDWQNASVLSSLDKAVMQAVDETLDDGMISDATWAEIAKGIASAAQRVELVVAIGNWTLFAQLLKSLRVPLEEGVEAWPPDGKTPASV